MRVTPSPLAGLLVIELRVFGDQRGRFVETYQRERYVAAGIDAAFEQDNFSSSTTGTLRGLHYQRTRPQGKLIHVTRGEIFDVALDIRRGSPTFGQHFATRLSAANGVQLWIPAGFAHGFYVTSEQADVAYKTTDIYVPADERAIRWDDPQLAIEWPLQGPPTLSARDASAPLLAAADLPA